LAKEKKIDNIYCKRLSSAEKGFDRRGAWYKPTAAERSRVASSGVLMGLQALVDGNQLRPPFCADGKRRNREVRREGKPGSSSLL
jgi:hypothetical protein